MGGRRERTDDEGERKGREEEYRVNKSYGRVRERRKRKLQKRKEITSQAFQFQPPMTE